MLKINTPINSLNATENFSLQLSVETTELKGFSSTTAEKQGTVFNNKFIILLLRTIHKNYQK